MSNTQILYTLPTGQVLKVSSELEPEKALDNVMRKSYYSSKIMQNVEGQGLTIINLALVVTIHAIKRGAE